MPDCIQGEDQTSVVGQEQRHSVSSMVDGRQKIHKNPNLAERCRFIPSCAPKECPEPVFVVFVNYRKDQKNMREQ